jgi:pimeloyl-ACP methyl ester carboxylesterase
MKFLRNSIFLLLVVFFTTDIFAVGQYTKINNVQIYSEYYPNPAAKFKGTMIFENASAEALTEWKTQPFFNCAKQLGSFFLYDRNGLGKSSADLNTSVQKPITAELVAGKLRQLLAKQRIKPPYILISHSYGGLYAGYFIRKYPSLVIGSLMIDPNPPQFEWAPWVINNDKVKEFSKLSSVEMYTKYSFANAKKLNTSPAEVFYQVLGTKQTQEQIAKLAANQNIPIIVLSSNAAEKNKNPSIVGDWYQMQKNWLNKNPNSKILEVTSSHFIQRDQPQLVCMQLKSLVNITINKM